MKKFLKGSLLCFCTAQLTLAIAQNDTITPGDNLVVQGIPPLPVALTEDINRYTEFRSASLTSWHPRQRKILIATRFADTNQIHSVNFPGGARTQLTFFKDSVDSAGYQPTHGQFFIFNKGSGGNENFQKYRFDVDTSTITLLTDGKSRNTGGVWSNSGEYYAYESTRRNGEDLDIWIMNPMDPASNRMVVELKGGGWSIQDFSPNDQQLLVGEYISANESYLWLVDIESGVKTLITSKVKGKSEKILYTGGQFSKDGKGIYVATDRGSEFQRLAYIDLKTKKHTYLTDSIPWDVEDFNLSWDGKTIAFVTNEEGFSVLHLWDTENRKELPVPTALPKGVFTALIWHRNNRDLGFGVTSARSANDSYSLDITTGTIERWTQSETGGLNTVGFAEPDIARWKSFDGKMISGFYYKPPAKFSGKRPVIIDIHGGPESQSRPGFQGKNNYFINEMGIALIKPNIRGSTGYGKTFLKLDNGFLRENSYKDIAALLDWIRIHPDLDADRVMVTGGSYGGHMTLAIATFYPERIRCALEVVGLSNIVTFLENTSAYRRDLRRVEYGDERNPKMREFLNRIAPVNNAEKITKPLFVVQGANDPRVPLSEAEQIVQTMQKKGTPVWYLMAKDEGHGFAKKKNIDFQLYSTVLFIKEFLLK